MRKTGRDKIREREGIIEGRAEVKNNGDWFYLLRLKIGECSSYQEIKLNDSSSVLRNNEIYICPLLQVLCYYWSQLNYIYNNNVSCRLFEKKSCTQNSYDIIIKPHFSPLLISECHHKNLNQCITTEVFSHAR